MRYFKGITSGHFKKDIDGKMLFLPHGVLFGERFIIESKDKANQIQKELIKELIRQMKKGLLSGCLFSAFYFLLLCLPIFIKVDMAIFYGSSIWLIFASSILMCLRIRANMSAYISKVTKNLQRQEKKKFNIKEIFEIWREAATHFNLFLLVFLGVMFFSYGCMAFNSKSSATSSACFSSLISLPIILLMMPIAIVFDLVGVTGFPFLLSADFINIVIIQSLIKAMFWGFYSFTIVGIGYMIFVKFQGIWNQFIKKRSSLYSLKG